MFDARGEPMRIHGGLLSLSPMFLASSILQDSGKITRHLRSGTTKEARARSIV
ncbi:MAG: hypothetical protein OZSIB_2575 [Candidatus Ozemobacter sibiricus]|uniref:Uncharacterized protein n=1 Tax=Candidatus Ozemobacter sibiricus TaxID=2268124 RepID=A0A367ZIA2_9BACT|nr:MAG: hypothetical protein OZSIB_2575 [Candidatus Ozemobacter sibiricus]